LFKFLWKREGENQAVKKIFIGPTTHGTSRRKERKLAKGNLERLRDDSQQRPKLTSIKEVRNKKGTAVLRKKRRKGKKTENSFTARIEDVWASDEERGALSLILGTGQSNREKTRESREKTLLGGELGVSRPEPIREKKRGRASLLASGKGPDVRREKTPGKKRGGGGHFQK